MSQTTHMTNSDPIRRGFQAFNEADVETLLALFHGALLDLYNWDQFWS